MRWVGCCAHRTNRLEFEARTRPTERGDRDRCEFRNLIPAGGCIDLREFARLLRRTLPSNSGRFGTKCVASRRICGGVATASRKATPLPACCLSTRLELMLWLIAVGVRPEAPLRLSVSYFGLEYLGAQAE